MRSIGLFDLQVNGFAGIDFNSPSIDAEAIDHALEAMLATGVTGCLPTIITASRDALAERLSALDRAVAASRLGPVMVPGYHLEGPFLNPGEGYAGCHPAGDMIAADAGFVARLERDLSRPILLVTLAPEQPGGKAFIQAVAATKLVAIGHSAVEAADVVEAAAAGARLSTHLGNGLPQILPKLNNSLFAQLAEDRLSASFIADGIHLPRPALKVMLKAKGVEGSILVTDAVSAAAAKPGLHPFAGMEVELAADGSVRVPGGRTLAGSSLTLDQAVRNLVAWKLATPDEAIAMAAINPRRLLAPTLASHGLSLAEGEVEWSADLMVTAVRIGAIERQFSEKGRQRQASR